MLFWQPLGSLTHSFIYLMEITKNIAWTAEAMTYFSQSHHQKLHEEAEKSGIELSLKYFEALDSVIGSFENPLYTKHALELYLHIFKAIHSANKVELQKFSAILKNQFYSTKNTEYKHEHKKLSR